MKRPCVILVNYYGVTARMTGKKPLSERKRSKLRAKFQTKHLRSHLHSFSYADAMDQNNVFYALFGKICLEFVKSCRLADLIKKLRISKNNRLPFYARAVFKNFMPFTAISSRVGSIRRQIAAARAITFTSVVRSEE